MSPRVKRLSPGEKSGPRKKTGSLRFTKPLKSPGRKMPRAGFGGGGEGCFFDKGSPRPR